MKTRTSALPASASPTSGLLARLMAGAQHVGGRSPQRRLQWRRALAESLAPPGEGLAERMEWVGSRETGVIRVPRD